MESRVEVELSEIKRSLEKCLHESNNEEQIYDLLSALERVQFTPKLIKETKLGNVVATIRGKFKTINAKITDKSHALMASWKSIMDAAAKGEHSSDTKEKEKETKKEKPHKPEPVSFSTSSSNSSSSSSGKIDMNAVQGKVHHLPASRKSIYSILLATVAPACAHETACSVALSIEEALNKQHPADSQLKAYTNKAKSLAFNLKKNEAVRQHVVCGTISSNDFVNLSAADLASHEQKLVREKLQAEVVDARRSDWLEAHKQELDADIGIDPNNKWDYDLGGDGNNSEPDVEGD